MPTANSLYAGMRPSKTTKIVCSVGGFASFAETEVVNRIPTLSYCATIFRRLRMRPWRLILGKCHYSCPLIDAFISSVRCLHTYRQSPQNLTFIPQSGVGKCLLIQDVWCGMSPTPHDAGIKNISCARPATIDMEESICIVP